ncbi:MAG TPA: thioredoxin domain-containing protein, partial [Tepidisphaeraceae bacterium]|nr:thioredoxin domain-containing protein [Tepidisphaeraceae bacterium]
MHTNHLINETSPYLLQHAHNPVDWYAWGPDAFEAARSQNKPIFLSVGYSTCYWCHVMERQCFEIESIAAVMNEHFINIKVDREERPDVDQLYMLAVQILTHHGGWPMSVFLTPDLRPFYGGTYFPPTDSQGRPGFPTVLRAISDAYHNRRDDVNRSAEQLVNILQQIAKPQAAGEAITIDDSFIRNLIERSIADYDSINGGFGSAPKFPRETLLELLLQSQIANRKSQILTHSLDAMANGGIRDHLGGGFHRYSTDAKWLVPHFEIMLYDNAMLGWCYVEAFRQTGEKRYARIARGIFDFVLREMTSPAGAFYTAIDAEVDAMEGDPYLWTAAEVETILGQSDAKLFNKAYGLDRGPNFADPHHGSGEPDKNVLYLPDGPAMEDDSRIVAIREKLYQARQQRKQPSLDTKIITSWNALMIRALAHGGEILKEDRYTQAAAKAADFLLQNHRKIDGTIYRTSRDGKKKYAGFLDDYAFLAQALLELKWNDKAAALAKVMLEKFYDESDGGFFFTERNADELIVRQKVASDSPLPSGNAIAAMVMLELGDRETAKRTLAIFANQLSQQGEGMSAMIQAALEYVNRFGPLTVSRSESSSTDQPLAPEELAKQVVRIETDWINPSEL